MKAIYFDAQDYTGAPTRVYAYLGIPAGAGAGSPVPGIVLVHGGGGTAFDNWVTKWNARGYAAISIAVEGQADVDIDPDPNRTEWERHSMAGPVRDGIYHDSDVEPITDQWMYHAVANTVLANSLLRSLPEVDASKVGLMGISWGGVITSTAIGIDTRFAFAIPTYGCGHKYDARNNYGTSLGNNDLYRQVWDPMVRITNATMPVLWYSWPREWHFPLDCQAYTYHGATGTRMVSIVHGWGHGHDWNRPESYDFADSIVSNGAPWCVQQSVGLAGSVAQAVFTSSKPLTEASLLYGVSNEVSTVNLGWVETSVTSLVEGPAGTWTVTANMPAEASGWYIKVEAAGSDTNNLYGYTDTNVVAGSDYQEIIKVTSGGGAIDHPVGEPQSTGSVSVVFSVPSNIEITGVQIGSESHSGSFSNVTALPVAMTSSPGSFDVEFDNSVAGLSLGQTATGIVTVTWEHLDGSTDQAQLPVSATITAVPTTITIDDSNILRPEDRDGDGDGDGWGNVDFRLVGYYEHDGVENMHLVWAFQMTGVSHGVQIADADFSVSQNGRVGSAHSYDIEAHVVRTSSVSDLGAGDYETSAGLLMTNFHVGAVSGQKSLDAAGRSALTTYLENNWAEGEYIVIGLKTAPRTVATYSGGGRELDDYHHYSTNAVLRLAILPPQGAVIVIR